MFSKLCIRKPVTTIMVTLMVFIAGIVSYFNLDQALMPDMDLPIAVVMTTYVGASPEEIEELISKPMEESLGSIANVDTVTSIPQPIRPWCCCSLWTVRTSTWLRWICEIKSTK